ncbi:Fic family protein [Thiothrix nivea]|uniref:Filamentation induced by cAMP protein Fic n=1 Tax=Thiothrix nivea (strain ATCC 35100 / DSM 5205 / JP2) TaxID=870187 RepID=A0A656HFZ0_THINJ|nr:Fic family protein [Thiothrix nivea]EIJ35367.1 filamentation induced by cAMP protein Fic [Thiothrix nivea DSM 5205]
MPYQPPFTITNDILTLVADISERVGQLKHWYDKEIDLRLRRINRIRSVAGSLAIEGNTLTEEQITALLDGKLVIAPPREIQEAKNALDTYEQMPKWNPRQESDLLVAHKTMMLGLIDSAGMYRSGGVGVFAGKQVLHMAPPANQLHRLMADLFQWLQTTDTHPLVASSVFHFEFEFIHPFADGNGRMGRLWQTLILSKWHPLFANLPVESLVHKNQAAYYQALQDSTHQTDCAPFISFMLGMIRDALRSFEEKTPVETQVKTRVKVPEQILELLQQQPTLTLAEVAGKLGKSVSAIERAAAKLRKEGRLRRVGPIKGGHWEVVQN